MIIKTTGAIAAFLLVLYQFFSYPVFAQESIISENGATSTNKVLESQAVTTLTTQINTLKLTNNISIRASTGKNEASDNEGMSQITTGDVNINASVLNEGLNSSKIFFSKPEITGETEISDNGEDSDNEAEGVVNYNNKSVVNNHIELNNTVSIKADSGSNKVSGNVGLSSIFTGNIYLEIILSNRANINSFQCCIIPQLLFGST